MKKLVVLFVGVFVLDIVDIMDVLDIEVGCVDVWYVVVLFVVLLMDSGIWIVF